MKKTLLLSLLVSVSGIANAQNVYNFGFSGTTTEMETAGWVRTNQSSPSTATLWSIASYTPVTVNLAATPAVQGNPFNDREYATGEVSPVPNGQAGGANSFAPVNYTSTTGAGDISNWLISPVVTVENGDVVSFWSRKGTSATLDFADRLELRMSTAATHTNPAGGSTNVGSFTTVGVTVNPTLATGFVYPKVWTKYSFTVSGLSGPTAVKFGFRYFVTNGGPSGDNSDLIGIDTFEVSRALSRDDFFANNFSMYPNPSTGIVNLSGKNNVAINTIQLTDLNGRVVRNINANGVSETQINISELTSGVYFLNIQTDSGTGTTKVVKN
ncbi:T9SS type A sorting domain-containing protein [Flavobacterium lindanitolerans]|nr:T9SS type A sorting domain-containing protein [Flavobacterium lindanitolerans]